MCAKDSVQLRNDGETQGELQRAIFIRMPDEAAASATILGVLLMQSPRKQASADALAGLCSLDLAHEWPYGLQDECDSVQELLREASGLEPELLDREFHHLFVGPNKLAAPPWGSVYLDSEAVVFGDSCMDLVRWMRERGIELHEGDSREPVDQIGRMFMLLGWLVDNKPELVGEFLENHMLTWAFRYLELLRAAAEGPLYQAIAELARITLAGFAQDCSLEVEQADKLRKEASSDVE